MVNVLACIIFHGLVETMSVAHADAQDSFNLTNLKNRILHLFSMALLENPAEFFPKCKQPYFILTCSTYSEQPTITLTYPMY